MRTTMKRRWTLAVGSLVLLGASTTGCVQLEYGLALERDLSGTATLDVEVDLERMAYVSARMQRMFAGAEGEPTEEEIEAARQELLAQAEQEEAFSEETVREEITDDLPEGVELLEVETGQDGLRHHLRVSLAFDRVDRLREMAVDAGGGEDEADEGAGEAGAGAAPAGGAPEPDPFGDLEVMDEGETILITNAALNPVAEAREQAQGGVPGLEGMLGRVFEGLRVAFSIRAPFEVVEHNATRVDGSTLWWEYDFAALAGQERKMPDHIMVRYRK